MSSEEEETYESGSESEISREEGQSGDEGESAPIWRTGKARRSEKGSKGAKSPAAGSVGSGGVRNNLVTYKKTRRDRMEKMDIKEDFGLSKEFFKLFRGKSTIASSGLSYKKSYDKVLAIADSHPNDPFAVQKVIVSCLVFAEKPARFLITGHTKSGKGDGVGIDQSISTWLPQRDQEDISSTAQDTKMVEEMKKARANWGQFENISLTAIRNINFMFIEANCSWFASSKIPIFNQLSKVYKGKSPSQITMQDFKTNLPELAKKYRMEAYQRFQENVPEIRDVIEGFRVTQDDWLSDKGLVKDKMLKNINN